MDGERIEGCILDFSFFGKKNKGMLCPMSSPAVLKGERRSVPCTIAFYKQFSPSMYVV